MYTTGYYETHALDESSKYMEMGEHKTENWCVCMYALWPVSPDKILQCISTSVIIIYYHWFVMPSRPGHRRTSDATTLSLSERILHNGKNGRQIQEFWMADNQHRKRLIRMVIHDNQYHATEMDRSTLCSNKVINTELQMNSPGYETEFTVINMQMNSSTQTGKQADWHRN